MQVLQRIGAVIIFLIISWVAKAHQPDLSTTLLVEKGENEWVLQVRASLTAFEYEIEEHYGESSYDSPQAFQTLALEYIRDRISIIFNDSELVALKHGVVKLGHETIVAFQVDDAPRTLKTLEVTNDAFRDIPRNKVALIILKEGYSKDQFFLSNDNNHSVLLTANDSTFEVVSTTEKTRRSGVATTVVIIILNLIIIYIAFKRKNNSSMTPRLQNA